MWGCGIVALLRCLFWERKVGLCSSQVMDGRSTDEQSAPHDQQLSTTVRSMGPGPRENTFLTLTLTSVTPTGWQPSAHKPQRSDDRKEEDLLRREVSQRNPLGRDPSSIQSSYLSTRKSGTTLRRVSYRSTHSWDPKGRRRPLRRGFSLSEPRASSLRTMTPRSVGTVHQGTREYARYTQGV